MTEASRVQKMLTEQNEWIDKLKSQIMRLELDIVGYRVRNKQLETALRKIADIEHEDLPKPVGAAEGTLWVILAGCVEVAEKALEGKDD
jgi:predicted  nucleic acid-binding Zn-ribbon protein